MSIDESRIESVQSGRRGGRRRAGRRAAAPPTSPTSTASTPPTSSAPPTRRPRRCAASGPSRGRCRRWRATPQPIERRPEDVPAERKAELLRELDERGRGAGRRDRPARSPPTPRPGARSPSPTPRGCSAATTAPAPGSAAQAVARRGDAVETGAETLGAHRGFELLRRRPGADRRRSAAGKALTLLDAGPAPAGSMPVVVGGGFGGVLFHEMTGHGLEADHIQKGASVYAGKLGEQVAAAAAQRLRRRPPAGRVGQRRDRRRGHADPEDAGDRGGPAHLLPLRPRCGAERDGVASTGNGRRESFRHLPIPRMTNTYIAPGDAEPGGDDRRGRAAASTRSPSPAARSTRRPATSSSASPRAT